MESKQIFEFKIYKESNVLPECLKKNTHEKKKKKKKKKLWLEFKKTKETKVFITLLPSLWNTAIHSS